MVEAQRNPKFQKTLESSNDCPECGHTISEDFRTGDYVCRGCGLICGKIIDLEQEWRSYSMNEHKLRSRAGPPIVQKTQHLNLTTYISLSFKDAFRKHLTPKARAEFHRLIKWDHRCKSQTSIDRNIFKSNNDIDVLSSQLKIPDKTKNLAAIIYKKALLKKMLRGRSIPELVAASLYTACKIYRIIFSLTEFERVSLISKKSIWRVHSLLVKILDIKALITYRSADYLPQIISALEPLKISNETKILANKILKLFERKNFRAKDQRGIAAAALYCAAKKTHEKLTQKELAAAASITEVTIRTNFHIMQKLMPIGGFK